MTTMQGSGGGSEGDYDVVSVHLECVCPHTHLGQSVFVVGDCPSLGCWRINQALQLQTNEHTFPTWKTRGSVRVHRNKQVEFKFLIMDENRHYVNWEPTGNRRLSVNSPALYRTEFGQEHNYQVTTLPEQTYLEAEGGRAEAAAAAEPRPQAKWLGRSPDASTASLQRLASFPTPQQQQQLPFCRGSAAAAAYGSRSSVSGGGAAAAGVGSGSSRYRCEGDDGAAAAALYNSSSSGGRRRRSRNIAAAAAAGGKEAAALPENGLRPCWSSYYGDEQQQQREPAADAAAGDESRRHRSSSSSGTAAVAPLFLARGARAAAAASAAAEGEEDDGHSSSSRRDKRRETEEVEREGREHLVQHNGPEREEFERDRAAAAAAAGEETRQQTTTQKKRDDILLADTEAGEEDERTADKEEEEITHTATCSPALRVLVEGDRNAKSWREKIEVVRNVLLASGLKAEKCVRHSAEELLSLIDGLSYTAIYLRFVSLGDVTCVEDGRHFRPNYHALLSKELCVLLEQLMLDVNNRDDALGDAVRLLVRAVAPSLPSFHAAFTAAQPLTRIRDIAHRNDIPPELKNEIKHSLQNKLHRCAGPEDLVTAQQFLERFHAQRDAYPPAFIAEYEKFYDELTRFFNATELETRLNEMRLQDNPRMNELITRFLEAKARMDDPTASVAKLLVTLTVCLELRCSLNYQLRDSVPAAADREASHHVQDMRLAEVLLDDVAFVLLSRIENLLTQLPDSRWAEAIEALALGVRDVKVSGLRRDECRALDAELAMHACRVVHAREDWLVIKATLERVQRLAEDCTDLQLALFSGRAAALGRELKLPPHSVRLYSEAAVRSSIVFQISKMCTGLLRRVRLLLNLQPYDVLVPGRAAGVVLLCDTLEDGVLQCVRVNHSSSSMLKNSSSSMLNNSSSSMVNSSSSLVNNSSSSVLKSSNSSSNRADGGAEGEAAAGGGAEGGERGREEEMKGAFDKERIEKHERNSSSSSNSLLPAIILAARTASGDEELGGLDGPTWRVEGIVIGHDMPVLSHLGVRARQHAIPFVACEEHVAFDPLVAAEGKTILLSADCVTVSLSVLEGAAAETALQQQEQRRLQQQHQRPASPDRGGGRASSSSLPSPVQSFSSSSRACGALQLRSPLYPYSAAAAATLRAAAAEEGRGSTSFLRCLSVDEITRDNSGSKAATCALLRGVAAAAQAAATEEPPPPLVFDAPNCLAFPFGTMEWLLRSQGKQQNFQRLIEQLEHASIDGDLNAAAAEMQQLIMELTLPEVLLLPVQEVFGARGRLVIRSSANTEDLKDCSAAGLYESVANVCVGDIAFQSAVLTVWASLYSSRAVLARRSAGIPQHQACMAVLLQELVNPELCFILHTENPLDAKKSEFLYAEVAPGLGETLAGAKMRGSPYRLIVNKSTGELSMLAFCNYSHAVVPVMPRTKSFSTLRDGKKQAAAAAASVDPSCLVKTKVIDYTLEPMTQNEDYRMHVAHSLAEVAVALEEKLGGPQDVEGVISRECVWVVQSRPQKVTDTT